MCRILRSRENFLFLFFLPSCVWGRECGYVEKKSGVLGFVGRSSRCWGCYDLTIMLTKTNVLQDINTETTE